jgi:hypothetical protein
MRAGFGVAEHQAATVQAEQFAHQVQHFAYDNVRRQAFADELYDLPQEQQLLTMPIDRCLMGCLGWHDSYAESGCDRSSVTASILPAGGRPGTVSLA